MDEGELQDWIYFFTKVHKGCKFYYPEDKEFHKLLEEFPQGISTVGDTKPELLCDFRADRFPRLVED